MKVSQSVAKILSFRRFHDATAVAAVSAIAAAAAVAECSSHP
jgi:hypothetical protein